MTQSRENDPHENDFGHFVHENMIPRQEWFRETMETFTSEFDMRLSQEMDSMMSMMHSQINRAINTAIAERVFPEIQNIVSSMSSLGNRDTEASSSPNSQENTERNSGFNRDSSPYRSRAQSGMLGFFSTVTFPSISQ